VQFKKELSSACKKRVKSAACELNANK